MMIWIIIGRRRRMGRLLRKGVMMRRSLLLRKLLLQQNLRSFWGEEPLLLLISISTLENRESESFESV